MLLMLRDMHFIELIKIEDKCLLDSNILSLLKYRMLLYMSKKKFILVIRHIEIKRISKGYFTFPMCVMYP